MIDMIWNDIDMNVSVMSGIWIMNHVRHYRTVIIVII